MKPYKHALISAKRFGGDPEDYMFIHDWMDHTKAHVADVRHRMMLHNSWGIYICEQVFGTHFKNSAGSVVQVRDVAEQHVLDDLGTIPSMDKCFASMSIEQWMGGMPRKRKTVTMKKLKEMGIVD